MDAYINKFEVKASKIDFELKCENIISNGEVRREIVLQLTPLVAKSLAIILSKSVSKYEQAHGEILGFSGSDIESVS